MATSEVQPPDNEPAQPGPAKKQGNPRTRVIGAVLGVVAVAVGVVYGLHWWTTGRYIESTDDAYLRADSVSVAPKVSGYVAEVYVQADQMVKKGDPLVRLDNRQYQAQLDQAQATIDARQADIEKANADIQQEQAQMDQAKSQEELARVNLRHAREEYERYEPLIITGASTAEKLAELRNARDQAEANLASSQAAVKSAQSHLAASHAQVLQARAQVKVGEAGVRQSTLDVGDTVVRSALDGRVGDNSVRVGQFAQPGTRMMTIVPVQQVYLVANFKETQIGRMRIGQPATVHVDALPGVDLHGVVESFSPGTGAQFALLPPENATGNFTKIVQRVPVRIRLDTGPETRKVLLPGLSVTTDVDTKAGTEQDKRIAQENKHG